MTTWGAAPGHMGVDYEERVDFDRLRSEEEVVVTSDGAKVLTLFPADELFVANQY